MGRTEDAVDLFIKGHKPLAISKTLSISLNSVLGYLDRGVGQGRLRRSDIYFSFSPDLRIRHKRELERYIDARSAFGDMYEDIRRIELSLHTLVRKTLVEKYGERELEWWRQGIPEPVRVKCQERREKDMDDPCGVYCYTDLLDLAKIMESQWHLMKDQLATGYSANRKALLEHLTRLNRLRNKVMHPIRGIVPSEEDFDFVHQFERDLALSV